MEAGRGIKARLKERWRAIRLSRANLALVIAGAALIIMSPVWRFGVAPAIKVVANDFDSLYSFDGTATAFLTPMSGLVDVTVPVLVEQRLSGRPDLSTPKISAVQENVRTLAINTGEELPAHERIFTVDRRTGELVKASGADRVRSGFYIVFPFETPEEDLPYWVEQAGRAETARFAGNDRVEGLSVRVFEVEYHNVPVDAPEGFPWEMTGAQLKTMLGMPGLNVAEGDSLPLTYLASGRRTVLVEPKAGTPVQLENVEESVSLAAGKPGGGYSFTRVISSLRYSQSGESVKQAVAFAKDEVAKIRLQFTWIPLGLAALGIAVLLTGAFAGIRFISESCEPEDTAAPPDATGPPRTGRV